jgi:hypothetical protein
MRSDELPYLQVPEEAHNMQDRDFDFASDDLVNSLSLGNEGPPCQSYDSCKCARKQEPKGIATTAHCLFLAFYDVISQHRKRPINQY